MCTKNKEGILDIANRTENWKTAQTFLSMCPQQRACFANRLLKSYCSASKLQPDEVRLELFWRGVRDHIYATEGKQEHKNAFANLYKDSSCFSMLRENIKVFKPSDGLKPLTLKDWNYSLGQCDWKDNLFNNLYNTEIDIVLSSANYLFIGEAKYKSKLRTQSKWVLPHQLVRQYVTATILLKDLDCKKEVVPFIVWEKGNNQKYEVQVQFMISLGWLRKDNILTWKEVEEIAGA